MNRKLVIVDYGMGNIKSITSTLIFLGVDEVLVTNNFDELKNSEKIILPGVGSFAKAMSKIIENKIEKKLYELVKINKKPLLGICLGMQLLCNSSTEDGFTKGASLADGATLERAMSINHWHSQHGGMYKQHFVKGFKQGRMNKIRHDNKQYNLNLKLMKDGSIRRGEQK